jgi:GNAT superfamily N-acetyltransferase
MRVVEAERAQMETVLRQSHAVWSEGMSVDDYLTFNLEQQGTAWGREHCRFLAGIEDDGAIACGMKLYTFAAEIDGAEHLLAGVGAVFTAPDRRGRGLAAALVESALELARADGQAAALLISDIGGACCERLGFRALPAQEAGCLPFLPVPWRGEPAWLRGGNAPGCVDGLREFRAGDLDQLVAIHEEATRGLRFRLRRDRPAWEQTLFRMALGHRLRRDGADILWVIERGGAVLAYVVLKEVRAALQWKEHGARLGSEDLLIELFWAALAHARAMGVNRVDAWHLPAVVTTRRVYPVAVRPQRDPVIMLRPLGAHAAPAFTAPEECRVSWLDIF